jgi:sarcosine oxidase
VAGTTHADVVIVGGGLLGLATAYALRGTREVVVFERDTVGHARSGSHGPTRVFRIGYGDDRYVRMAQEARSRWDALEAETGVRLFSPTPQLTFGPGSGAVFDALRCAGAPVSRLTAEEIAEQFPAFAGHGDAVLEQASAVIAADAALDALRRGMDAELREHVEVRAVGSDRIETDEGVVYARAVVVCAGPWTRALVPSLQTHATLEHLAYVRPASTAELPIFIDHREPTTYGLPTPGSDLYKLALHHAGPTVDPDAPFIPDARVVDQLREAAASWLPDGEIVDIDVCPYDNTVDEDFVIARVDGITVGAGTSGHAFKFGPLLGERLAALAREGA